MLLQVQKPGLNYAASEYDWRDRFDRTIKEGARPLLILWPFGPVALVYDELDTEGGAPQGCSVIFRTRPSRCRANCLIRKTAAEEEHAIGAGDLSERAQHRVVELADDAERRRRAPRSFWHAMEKATSAGIHRDGRLPEPGAQAREVPYARRG
jgi:hypothetical protein